MLPCYDAKKIGDKLVNSLRGMIAKIFTNIITVHFNNYIVVDLKRETFTVYSSLDNKIVFSRQQFSLRLAFAITFHTSQGLTLDHVEVDVGSILPAGN